MDVLRIWTLLTLGLALCFAKTEGAFPLTTTIPSDGFCNTNSQNSFCLKPDADCVNGSLSDPLGPIVIDKLNQTDILDRHNSYRRKVASGGETLGAPGPQPGSKCMNQLVWDDELARGAQNWADQCVIAVQTSTTLDGTTPYGKFDTWVSQNVYGFIDRVGSKYYDSSSNPQQGYWRDAIDSWYNEVANNNGTEAKIKNYSYLASTSHYTQLVWGRTTKVGCGFRRWKMDDGTSRYIRLLICNYWPGGNVLGQPIYRPRSTVRPQPVPPPPQCAPGCDIYIIPNNLTAFSEKTLTSNLCV